MKFFFFHIIFLQAVKLRIQEIPEELFRSTLSMMWCSIASSGPPDVLLFALSIAISLQSCEYTVDSL